MKPTAGEDKYVNSLLNAAPCLLSDTTSITAVIVVFTAKVSPDWAPAASSQKSVNPTVTPPTRPEEDILFQWRLRRKMEQARGSSQSVKQSGLHDSDFSWQAPSLVNALASELPQKVRFKSV